MKSLPAGFKCWDGPWYLTNQTTVTDSGYFWGNKVWVRYYRIKSICGNPGCCEPGMGFILYGPTVPSEEHG